MCPDLNLRGSALAANKQNSSRLISRGDRREFSGDKSGAPAALPAVNPHQNELWRQATPLQTRHSLKIRVENVPLIDVATGKKVSDGRRVEQIASERTLAARSDRLEMPTDVATPTPPTRSHSGITGDVRGESGRRRSCPGQISCGLFISRLYTANCGSSAEPPAAGIYDYCCLKVKPAGGVGGGQYGYLSRYWDESYVPPSRGELQLVSFVTFRSNELCAALTLNVRST
ncbi:hypothetical protein J6590_057795 [Homalodisca vitripennis]|nr:hypothetical protein J6590_057795 [Homalodisca vitripennis]